MSDLIQPFGTYFDLSTGVVPSMDKDDVLQRRLSDMRGMYADHDAEDAVAAEGDPLIYEVYTIDLPAEIGQVPHCTTVIHPGRIGDEYYMTKGHFHALRDRGEVYFGLAGKGYLLLQTDEGDVEAVLMTPGVAAYVPPYWAHRTINVGDEPFVFFAAWPGDAGHDYGTIEEKGFAKILVDRDGEAVLVDNPNYK